MSDSKHYFSFAEQTLHYFDRVHTGALDTPQHCAAAWSGASQPPLEHLAHSLSDTEVSEILAAVAHTDDLGLPTQELTVSDFPLPALEPLIARWREELDTGIGFRVIRGVPTDRWSQQQCELFFWCFGLHLGRPGQQNPEGHLIGHVKNTGESASDPMARLYKTNANIDYHCDAADVVGLLCLNRAESGGKSRIVSSVSVFNALVQQEPELAARLFEPMALDVRDRNLDGVGSTIPIPPCRYAHGRLRTFYHADYFRSAQRHADVARFTPLEQKLLDTYEEIASDPRLYVDMDLQPGDIQLISNHTILHSRTDYVDSEDPAKARHLLRLWLSLNAA